PRELERVRAPDAAPRPRDDDHASFAELRAHVQAAFFRSCSFSRWAAILFARSSAAGNSAGPSIALTSGAVLPPASMRSVNLSSEAGAAVSALRSGPAPNFRRKKKR